MNRLAAEVLLCLAVAVGSFLYGAHDATTTLSTKHQAELAKINAASHQAVADATEAKRKQEADHAAAMAALDAKHHKELQDEITSKERAIADVRAGALRVRHEFTCPGSAAQRATGKAGTSTSVGDAAGAGGLQSTHVEFLLREAGRADEAVKQLQACQAVVRGDRGQP